jgi:SAM-dependent methyltransferase
MPVASANADQIAFWNGDAGLRWVEQQERLDAMMAGTTQALLDAAGPQPGFKILDIGCGCGSTAIAYAKAAGSSGRVLGLDVSAPMLAHARSRTLAANLSQIELREGDATVAPLDKGAFDLIASRFGVMFFSDPVAAFQNLRQALKPDGRLAFVCWRDWRQNEWVRVPVSAIRPHVPPQPPVGPEDPGPFAFADQDRVRKILTMANFDDIEIRALDLTGEFGANLEDAVAYMQSFGPTSRMLGSADATQRENAIAALRDALRPYANPGPIIMGLAQWLVTATADNVAA